MQFSNDVRVEVPPQSLSLEDLKGRLDELVRWRLTPSGQLHIGPQMTHALAQAKADHQHQAGVSPL